jgi:signal transduction histidine kinase
VVDNGIGIKEEDKGKIFKLFGLINDKNRSPNTQGIGLGLVISKLVVNKFDG